MASTLAPSTQVRALSRHALPHRARARTSEPSESASAESVKASAPVPVDSNFLASADLVGHEHRSDSEHLRKKNDSSAVHLKPQSQPEPALRLAARGIAVRVGNARAPLSAATGASPLQLAVAAVAASARPSPPVAPPAAAEERVLYAAYAAGQEVRMRDAHATAAARMALAGEKMRAASLKRLDKSFAKKAELRVGDQVRVSLLILTGVRRLLKSQLVGAVLPYYTAELFEVTAVSRDDDDRAALYNVKCIGCAGRADPRPALVNGVLAQVPSRLHRVQRHFLLAVPAGSIPGMGHAHPDYVPAL